MYIQVNNDFYGWKWTSFRLCVFAVCLFNSTRTFLKWKLISETFFILISMYRKNHEIILHVWILEALGNQEFEQLTTKSLLTRDKPECHIIKFAPNGKAKTVNNLKIPWQSRCDLWLWKQKSFLIQNISTMAQWWHAEWPSLYTNSDNTRSSKMQLKYLSSHSTVAFVVRPKDDVWVNNVCVCVCDSRNKLVKKSWNKLCPGDHQTTKSRNIMFCLYFPRSASISNAQKWSTLSYEKISLK